MTQPNEPKPNAVVESNGEVGPCYNVPLIKSMPLSPEKYGPCMTQAMPSRDDLVKVKRISERTVAGYEVLLNHFVEIKAERDGLANEVKMLELSETHDLASAKAERDTLKAQLAAVMAERDEWTTKERAFLELWNHLPDDCKIIVCCGGSGEEDRLHSVYRTITEVVNTRAMAIAERDQLENKAAKLEHELLSKKGYISCDQCGRLWSDDVDFSHCDCGRCVDSMAAVVGPTKLRAERDHLAEKVASLEGENYQLKHRETTLIEAFLYDPKDWEAKDAGSTAVVMACLVLEKVQEFIQANGCDPRGNIEEALQALSEGGES